MSDNTETAPETGIGFIANLPVPSAYTAQDCYRDFRKVFEGSDEGRRVLREILSWGHLFKPSIVAGPGHIDPLLMAVKEGERNIALRLLKTLTEEPKQARPDKANSQLKQGDA